MRTLRQILSNTSNSAVTQMSHIYKIWYSVLDNSKLDYLKPVTTPYSFDPYTKTLTIKVHDNLWYTDLSFMTEDFKNKLCDNNLEISKLVFKYYPKYEKIAKDNKKVYEISNKCQNYIENSIKKLDNKNIAESFRKYLIHYFQHNNFENWITK